MARLQILELPTEHHGDDMVTPFVLVIDQATDETAESLGALGSSTAELVRARTVLVFRETVEIPANNPVAPVDDAFRVEVATWATGTNELLARIIEAVNGQKRRTSSPAPESIGDSEEGWTGRPTRPDGTPYGYGEITEGGWESCEGCRTWGQWNAENPHDCPGTYIKGPFAKSAADA
ncbi:hypothetical protein [Streptomyces sp. NPDC047990]|uniref:hypothetical protein n=1 Tax=Streptomyces sp. NPDC047990 TaxID=3365496 RepID=UPI0037216167